jgi:hypothetical protein
MKILQNAIRKTLINYLVFIIPKIESLFFPSRSFPYSSIDTTVSPSTYSRFSSFLGP